jgi:hypothetical protein
MSLSKSCRFWLNNNFLIGPFLYHFSFRAKQMVISAIACGSGGKTLNSSYSNRDSNEYKVRYYVHSILVFGILKRIRFTIG